MKAIILCNNPVALPGIKEILFFGKVAAIAIPKRNREMQYILAPLLQKTRIPLLLIDKNNYHLQISQAIETYAPTVVLMMTFPFIIPQEILSIPKQGFINFHYGILPECRGPQPILWHLLNNDTHAGLTVHKVDDGIDTGDIIMQEKIRIEPNDTYGTLQAKSAFLGAKMAAGLMKILDYGSIVPGVRQDKSRAAYFNMPLAKQLTVNWNDMSAAEIVRLVNACNPWNKGAGTIINDWGIGLTEVEIVGDYDNRNVKPGEILVCNKEEGLIVAASDNKKLRINIIFTNEGFFSGSRLADFEVRAGNIFG